MNAQQPAPMSLTRTDSGRRIAVIGGGLCGLSAGNRLAELHQEADIPCQIVLFEAGTRLGGLVETRQIQGYLVEMGADSFITNKPAAVNLCYRLGLESELIPTDAAFRKSLVLHHGRPCPVPEGFQLLTPATIKSVLVSPLFSLNGKIRMALEPLIPRGKSRSDESLASFVRRRFGQEALERLVQPMVGGIYTSDPERLSLKATMPRFLEMEREHGSLLRAMASGSAGTEEKTSGASGARYGLFTTLRNGISQLIESLVNRLREENIDLRLNTRVVRIEREAGTQRFLVELADGNCEGFDAVILTLPTGPAAQLIDPLNATLASLMRKIEYASSVIVVSGHQLKNIRDPLKAFGLVVPAVEKRRVLAVSFSSRKFPGRAPEGRVLLRTFVGGAMQPEEFERSDSEIESTVSQELQELLGVSETPDFMMVSRYPRSMPQYHVGHCELVSEIEHQSEKLLGFSLAGNAYHGVGIPDTIASGERAAERIFAQFAEKSR